jgi:hypothetical protein
MYILAGTPHHDKSRSYTNPHEPTRRTARHGTTLHLLSVLARCLVVAAADLGLAPLVLTVEVSTQAHEQHRVVHSQHRQHYATAYPSIGKACVLCNLQDM